MKTILSFIVLVLIHAINVGEQYDPLRYQCYSDQNNIESLKYELSRFQEGLLNGFAKLYEIKDIKYDPLFANYLSDIESKDEEIDNDITKQYNEQIKNLKSDLIRFHFRLYTVDPKYDTMYINALKHDIDNISKEIHVIERKLSVIQMNTKVKQAKKNIDEWIKLCDN